MMNANHAVAKEHVRQFILLKIQDRKLILSLVASLIGLLVTYASSPRRGLTIRERKQEEKRVAAPVRRKSAFQNDVLPPNHGNSTLRQASMLLKRAVPSLRSVEGLLLVIVSILLVARTFLTLQMSNLTGALGKHVVSGRKREFVNNLLLLILCAIPTSLATCSVQYCTEMLHVRFRNNLSRYFYGHYLSSRLFFKVAQLYGDDTMDQRLTADIDKWSQCAAGMYPALFKPILDAVIFSRKVAELGGLKGPLIVFAYYTSYALLAYTTMPRYGAMGAKQLEHEGRLRTAHQRLLSYAEEITMEQGQAYELRNLNRLFDTANRGAKIITYSKSWYGILEGMVVKYGSVLLGYAVCMFATFSPKAEGLAADEITSMTIRSTFLFVSLATAVGNLLRNVGTAMELGGYTRRVHRIEDALTWAEKLAKQQDDENSSGLRDGRIVIGDHVRFTDVPIISPDGVVLCQRLNFYVKPGMNLLIVGPNGCGKSSMFRLLGDLWPVADGTITKPPFSQLYYVPQRPYITHRTLREQIMYPHTTKDIHVSEAELFRCLELARLESIFSKPHMTWDTYIALTDDSLSVGEKQRLAMARLFFHKPRFAILDECSSAIDYDVEADIYQACKDLGISLITIAHRRSVWQYHNWILKFDGNGGYMFSPLSFDDNDDLILTKVEHASDASIIGNEVRVSPLSPTYPRGAGDIGTDSAATSARASRLTSPHPPPHKSHTQGEPAFLEVPISFSTNDGAVEEVLDAEKSVTASPHKFSSSSGTPEKLEDGKSEEVWEDKAQQQQQASAVEDDVQEVEEEPMGAGVLAAGAITPEWRKGSRGTQEEEKVVAMVPEAVTASPATATQEGRSSDDPQQLTVCPPTQRDEDTEQSRDKAKNVTGKFEHSSRRKKRNAR